MVHVNLLLPNTPTWIFDFHTNEPEVLWLVHEKLNWFFNGIQLTCSVMQMTTLGVYSAWSNETIHLTSKAYLWRLFLRNELCFLIVACSFSPSCFFDFRANCSRREYRQCRPNLFWALCLVQFRPVCFWSTCRNRLPVEFLLVFVYPLRPLYELLSRRFCFFRTLCTENKMNIISKILIFDSNNGE